MRVGAIPIASVTDIETNYATGWMEEQTNIHVEWGVFPSKDAKEKINLLLASGSDLPEVFLGARVLTPEQLMLYGSQGLFRPLDDYLAEQAFYIKEFFDEFPLLKKIAKMPDGNIYALGRFKLCYHCYTAQKVWYNKTWLDTQGRNLFMFMITFTMIFSGGLIPTYLLVRGLGMLNTRWVMMIPNAIAAWNVIITRTYYQSTIPDELHQAAQLDGCSDVRFLMSVVVPLSGAITAVNALFYEVAHWNAFFNAFIYLSKDEPYPLQIILREVLIQNDFDNEAFMDVSDQETREGLRELLKFSLIIVASVPVLCIYPFVQKYFVRGVMIGSIKG